MTESESQVEFDYRPGSYWDPVDPVSAVVGNVTGELRRRMIRKAMTSEARSEMQSALLPDTLTDDNRAALGRIHPSFMGGEYLGDYLPGEVEIARIALESTLADIISIRARRRTQRIKYRVVDEYESHFTYSHRTSRRPLTLGQVVALVDSIHDGSGSGVGDYITALREGVLCGATAEDYEKAEDFVSVDSIFYPHLERVYRERARQWCAREVAAIPQRVRQEAERVRREVEDLRRRADNGDAKAMCGLAYGHYSGKGVREDRGVAVRLWKRASELGNAIALNNLARCYMQGDGVDTDQLKGFELYEELAAKRHWQGLTAVAMCHWRGIGVSSDYEKALRSYKALVELMGWDYHHEEFRRCLLEGDGSTSAEQDIEVWLHEAAEEHRIARFILTKVEEQRQSGRGSRADVRAGFFLYDQTEWNEELFHRD